MMLVAVCSAKGSPGATSTALAIAAAWPQRRALLLEADAAGGDLAFRCRHASGREVAASPSLLGLATVVRGRSSDGLADTALLEEFSQPLACGVRVVPGPLSAAQARGLGGLWPRIADVAERSRLPVMADLGRPHGAETAAILARASVVIVVCQPSLESVTHAQQLIRDLAPTLAVHPTGRTILPVVVGPHRHGHGNAEDVDEVMSSAYGLPLTPSMPLAHDHRALMALEAGADPTGRLANTSLMRTAAAVVERLFTALSGLGEQQTATRAVGPA